MFLLGLGDIAAAGLLLSRAYNFEVSHIIVIVFAIYLLFKGLIFLADIGSLFDIVGGILLLLSLFIIIPNILLFLVAFLVGLKGIMSLVSRL